MALEALVQKDQKISTQLLDEIENSLKCNNFQKAGLIKRLQIGNTYQALELAQTIYSQGQMDEWLISKIAYKHYLKMQHSGISSKIINELIQMYPKLEYIKGHK